MKSQENVELTKEQLEKSLLQVGVGGWLLKYSTHSTEKLGKSTKIIKFDPLIQIKTYKSVIFLIPFFAKVFSKI